MSFIERQIIITITLQPKQGLPEMGIGASSTPTFTDTSGSTQVPTNNNTVTITGGGPAAQNGLRIAAQITRPGAPGFAQANVQIYNLPLSLINQLSSLGVPFVYQIGPNTITISAGDAGTTPTKIFQGTINQAWGNFDSAPESIFNISAQTGLVYGSAPAPTISFNGRPASGTILTTLAKSAGLTLVNTFPGGSTPPLSNQYLCSSIREQIRLVCQNAGINYDIDDVDETLTIGPKNGSLSTAGAAIPIIGPPPVGNMVGYPSYTAQGIKVKAEFSTAFKYGTTFQLLGSQLTPANTNWVINFIEYDLECQAEDGPWFVSLDAVLPGYTTAAAPSSP